MKYGYIINENKEQDKSGLETEIIEMFASLYLNGKNTDRVAMYVPLFRDEFYELLKRVWIDTAKVKIFGCVHFFETLNGGYISVVFDGDLPKIRSMREADEILKGFQFSQAYMFDMEKLNPYVCASIRSRMVLY